MSTQNDAAKIDAVQLSELGTYQVFQRTPLALCPFFEVVLVSVCVLTFCGLRYLLFLELMLAFGDIGPLHIVCASFKLLCVLNVHWSVFTYVAWFI